MSIRAYFGSHAAVVRVYNGAGNVIETHEHTGDFKELWVDFNHVTATQRIKV